MGVTLKYLCKTFKSIGIFFSIIYIYIKVFYSCSGRIIYIYILKKKKKKKKKFNF